MVLAARTLPSGGASYRARYTDPDTGRVVWQTLDASLSTHEQRVTWAKKLAATLARRRADRAAGIAPPKDPTTIEAAIATYRESAEVRLRAKTLATYDLGIARFAEWCGAEGIEHTADLTPAALARLRDAFIRAPKKTAAKGARRGRYASTPKPRSAVSINRELRTVATVLTSWRRRDLVSLSSDQIADALRKIPVERELPVYLTPSDLRRVLEAALRHDAETFTITREEHDGLRAVGTTPRYAAIAPVTAFLMLTGCRRNEAVTLRWSDVDLDALDASGAKVGEIRLRAAETKTKIARVVGLEVAPTLRRILAAMKLRAGDEERVFPDLTGTLLTSTRARLVAEYGAPEAFGWQVLRSTCATYLANAPAIYGAASAFLAARQLGHSVVVAEKRYAGQLRGISREARTLEAAMQIESELAGVLAAIGAGPAAPARARATS